MLDAGNFNQFVKARYGHIVYNKNDMFVGKAIETYGEYSEWEVKLFRQICQPGSLTMDIGANIGTHTLAMARFVGEEGFVYAFEPQQIVFQTLCANMAINSISNVGCLPYGVSDKDYYTQIPRIDYTKEANYGALKLHQFESGNKVKVISLDSYFRDARFQSLDFIKIDVEGMEDKVLTGAKDLIGKFRPIMYIENDKIEKSKGLIRLVKSMDYIPYWHYPPLYNSNNYFGVKENIYPNIVSINMICIPTENTMTIKGVTEATDEDYHILNDKGEGIIYG